MPLFPRQFSFIDLTFFCIALWGALISTLLGLWTISHEVNKSTRRLQVRSSIAHRDNRPTLVIKATNTGYRPVEIWSAEAAWGRIFLIFSETVSTQPIIPLASSSPLPIHLNDGQAVELKFDIEEIKTNLEESRGRRGYNTWLTGIILRDAEGWTHPIYIPKALVNYGLQPTLYWNWWNR